jgi:hypothetical protein
MPTNMFFASKKYSLIILGLTSLICSRTLFALFDDPEGPNLLVVGVMAAILYSASFAVYTFSPSVTALNRLLAAVATQILLVAVFYFFLH